MCEDLKSKVIDTIDSLIPKGQNSLSLREMDMVYGIYRAKEAVEKLFAESSTQPNDFNALDALDTISRQAAYEVLTDYYHHRTEIQHKALREALDMVPSAQPEYEPVTAEDFAKIMSENTLYNFVTWHQEALTLMERKGFVICKKTM